MAAVSRSIGLAAILTLPACLSAPPHSLEDGGASATDSSSPQPDEDAQPLTPYDCTNITSLDIDFSSAGDLATWNAPIERDGCSSEITGGSLLFTKGAEPGRCFITGHVGLDARRQSITAEIDPFDGASLGFSLILYTSDVVTDRTWLYFETDGQDLWRGQCTETTCDDEALAPVTAWDESQRFWRFQVSENQVVLQQSDDGIEFVAGAPVIDVSDQEHIACVGIDLGSYDNGDTQVTSGFTRLYTSSP